MSIDQLKNLSFLQVRQEFEMQEFLGFEGRNKYLILDDQKQYLFYATESGSGFGAWWWRQYLKHWRSFDMEIHDESNILVLSCHFPFRWFLKGLRLKDGRGKSVGSVEQRFAFFSKKYDLLNPSGRVVATIRSPFFKVWTFDVRNHNGKKLGDIQKNWSGTFSEIFSDRDNFCISFADQSMSTEIKALMLATTLMVDIIHFEK
jgi:uncharacterized protein YxjI